MIIYLDFNFHTFVALSNVWQGFVHSCTINTSYIESLTVRNNLKVAELIKDTIKLN
jgi:predicted RNA-binding protein with RPS1 domain